MFEKLLKDSLYFKIIFGILTLAVLIFSISFALGQYLAIKRNNIQALATWNACVQDSNLGDKAYDFCRTKCSDNYMFKQPFDWAEDGGISDGDE